MGQYLIPRLFIPVAWWQGRYKWKKKHLCSEGCVMPHPNVWNICYDLEKKSDSKSMKYQRGGRYNSKWRCQHPCTRCDAPCDVILRQIGDDLEGLETQLDYYEWKGDTRMMEWSAEKLARKAKNDLHRTST